MTYDGGYRFAQALDPSALATDPRRCLVPDETDRLVALFRGDAPLEAIAAALGRGRAAVATRPGARASPQLGAQLERIRGQAARRALRHRRHRAHRRRARARLRGGLCAGWLARPDRSRIAALDAMRECATARRLCWRRRPGTARNAVRPPRRRCHRARGRPRAQAPAPSAGLDPGETALALGLAESGLAYAVIAERVGGRRPSAPLNPRVRAAAAQARLWPRLGPGLDVRRGRAAPPSLWRGREPDAAPHPTGPLAALDPLARRLSEPARHACQTQRLQGPDPTGPKPTRRCCAPDMVSRPTPRWRRGSAAPRRR